MKTRSIHLLRMGTGFSVFCQAQDSKPNSPIETHYDHHHLFFSTVQDISLPWLFGETPENPNPTLREERYLIPKRKKK